MIAGITNYTVWFAIIFYAYLQTQAVIATSVISGIFLVATALSGFWLGSIVDHNKKKTTMLISSVISLISFAIGFFIYITVGESAFTSVTSPTLWVFILVLMVGVIAGNLRNIVLPTLVSILVPEKKRDRANGMVGTVTGVGFLVTSVISGILVGQAGMYLVLLLGVIATLLAIGHLFVLDIPEKIEKHDEAIHGKKIDIKGTIKVIRAVPGLPALIVFTMFNNFLGGVFMSLMDAYGLSLVSVEVWGILWGIISVSFIAGGIIIAKFGLGENPLKAMFRAIYTIWIVCIFFTIQPSIVLLVVGSFIYLAVVPFIEAAEHTIIQKVVPVERQGRVFGFAQSIEQAASPVTAFLIGPIAQFIFIPFMTTGRGVDLIGSWFGTGPARGIALVFTLTGIIGLIATILARNTKYYALLSARYMKK